ncbi:pentapeptide repeat-containing protein [Cronbergia sp. UHCC 0137]|uniref:pentapeptide repeat-containing protein n=1 Tax=Cronbergia sp. UHCC 0137 TaxID=3110239 RepID=UPI002B21FEB9|nr:pentapeptide repeat-containing protein [Cronbergia sp. UHCC 0137]MEA5619184.1 pentapeptide repeat-containing protein [Cronbergia sp. UHCC 0137]
MNAEDLLQRYAAGERDFTGVKLPGVRLVDKILNQVIFKGADFSDAYFESSGFDEVDLSFANLRRIRFFESGFGRANLEAADFSDAIFSQGSLKGANLTRAIFRRAVLSEVSFKNANLSYADLSEASEFSIYYCKGAIFHETIMPDGSIRSNNS